jgi:hypothetical protein
MAPRSGSALRRVLRGDEHRPLGVCGECLGDAGTATTNEPARASRTAAGIHTTSTTASAGLISSAAAASAVLSRPTRRSKTTPAYSPLSLLSQAPRSPASGYFERMTRGMTARRRIRDCPSAAVLAVPVSIAGAACLGTLGSRPRRPGSASPTIAPVNEIAALVAIARAYPSLKHLSVSRATIYRALDRAGAEAR